MNSHLNQIRCFRQNPSLCNLFKLFASDTWHRIGFAHHQRGLRIFETTLTQNIIYQFALYKQIYQVPVSIFEATNEKTNGNDIEFELRTPKGSVTLPMQAKLMYRNGRYPQMAHPGQIDSLIRYAENNNGYPLYLLYNYYPVKPFTPLYGISVVSAYHIRDEFSYPFRKKLKIPHFNSLHPTPAVPWHKLVCVGAARSPAYILSLFDEIISPPEMMVAEAEAEYNLNLEKNIPDPKQWATLHFDIFRKKTYSSEKEKRMADEYETKIPTSLFAPRYKILIGE